MASTKVQRIMTQPINLIFRFLQSKDLRIEGRIIGFDEYLNLVLDDAEEINIKKKLESLWDFSERRQHNSDDEHGEVIFVPGNNVEPIGLRF